MYLVFSTRISNYKYDVLFYSAIILKIIQDCTRGAKIMNIKLM